MNRIIFCDFDGTITLKETFVAVLKKFSPDVSGELIPQMYARKLTLRSGVRRILESVPSSCYGEILEFSRNQIIRPGFEQFLDFLEVNSVALVVVSGGLQGIIKTVMGELVHRVQAIYAVDVNTTGEYLRVNSEFEGETELVAKVQIMDRYVADQKIVIGDSLTDLNMALHAPIVFARDRLASYLDQQQKSYIPWDDFFQIRDYLEKMWD